MAKGRVKWFNNKKGYGFISAESGEEVFVHFTEIMMDGYRYLETGQEVEFELENNERGPKARKVVKA